MSFKVQADIDRILERCEIADCWEWQLSLDKDGYGKSHAGSRARGTMRWIHVHRFVYQELTGNDLEGLVIDHLCRNRKCCNPDHLEPVTVAVNHSRGYRPTALRCKQGHSFEVEGYVDKRGHRICRPCQSPSLRRAMLEKAVA